MTTIIRVTSGIIAALLSGYSLLTHNFNLMPFMMLSLGIFVFTSGIVELHKDRKAFWGYMIIIISLFILFVSIQGFMLD